MSFLGLKDEYDEYSKDWYLNIANTIILLVVYAIPGPFANLSDPILHKLTIFADRGGCDKKKTS